MAGKTPHTDTAVTPNVTSAKKPETQPPSKTVTGAVNINAVKQFRSSSGENQQTFMLRANIDPT